MNSRSSCSQLLYQKHQNTKTKIGPQLWPLITYLTMYRLGKNGQFKCIQLEIFVHKNVNRIRKCIIMNTEGTIGFVTSSRSKIWSRIVWCMWTFIADSQLLQHNSAPEIFVVFTYRGTGLTPGSNDSPKISTPWSDYLVILLKITVFHFGKKQKSF